MLIDSGVPLVTDVKCAKLLVQALKQMGGLMPPMKSKIDCITGSRLIRLPSLIDVHVHIREPGAPHKETWLTGTKAALAGGITMILAMPNTSPPVVDQASLLEAEAVGVF